MKCKLYTKENDSIVIIEFKSKMFDFDVSMNSSNFVVQVFQCIQLWKNILLIIRRYIYK